MGVSPDMSTSSTPASNVPAVKLAASMNQLLIKFTVNSLQRHALTSKERPARSHLQGLTALLDLITLFP